MLAIYVDDILFIGKDITRIVQIKPYQLKHLTIQDLHTPKYFLGIKFPNQSGKLVINQDKYVFDTLEEIILLGDKYRSSPINNNPNFKILLLPCWKM